MLTRTLHSCALLLLMAGCDVSRPVEVTASLTRPPPVFRASCITTSLGVCTEYTDEAFGLGESSLKAGCVEGRGAWSPARCPPERRLGHCQLSGVRRVYYSGGELDFTSATAEKDCVELHQGAFSLR
ncbi:MAG: hypothetical protein ABTQ32_37950 [Myxococcaceae bacterium]